MIEITTSIEIACSPEQVRDIFLNFHAMPEWSTSWFQSIEMESQAGTLNVGDKVRITLPSMKFTGKICENSPQRFAWRGGITGVVVGEHWFRFEPSSITPGGTTFGQGECFTGLFTPAIRSSLGGPRTKEGFEAFNRDLKRKAEEGA